MPTACKAEFLLTRVQSLEGTLLIAHLPVKCFGCEQKSRADLLHWSAIQVPYSATSSSHVVGTLKALSSHPHLSSDFPQRSKRHLTLAETFADNCIALGYETTQASLAAVVPFWKICFQMGIWPFSGIWQWCDIYSIQLHLPCCHASRADNQKTGSLLWRLELPTATE